MNIGQYAVVRDKRSMDNRPIGKGVKILKVGKEILLASQYSNRRESHENIYSVHDAKEDADRVAAKALHVWSDYQDNINELKALQNREVDHIMRSEEAQP